MLALLALALREAEIAVDTADVAAALSLDALRGSPAAFDAAHRRASALMPATQSPRAISSASTAAAKFANRTARARKDPRVQDPYSLRCAPQVHGAVRDALAQVRATLTIEINSATDNPLVFADSGRSDQRRKFSRPAAGHGRRSARRRAGHPRRNFRAPHRADDQPADQPSARFSRCARPDSIPAS